MTDCGVLGGQTIREKLYVAPRCLVRSEGSRPTAKDDRNVGN